MESNETSTTPKLQAECTGSYKKPAIEIIEMESEGILCASSPDFTGNNW